MEGIYFKLLSTIHGVMPRKVLRTWDEPAVGIYWVSMHATLFLFFSVCFVRRNNYLHHDQDCICNFFFACFRKKLMSIWCFLKIYAKSFRRSLNKIVILFVPCYHLHFSSTFYISKLCCDKKNYIYIYIYNWTGQVNGLDIRKPNPFYKHILLHAIKLG